MKNKDNQCFSIGGSMYDPEAIRLTRGWEGGSGNYGNVPRSGKFLEINPFWSDRSVRRAAPQAPFFVESKQGLPQALSIGKASLYYGWQLQRRISSSAALPIMIGRAALYCGGNFSVASLPRARFLQEEPPCVVGGNSSVTSLPRSLSY